ncbi:hypothetical protein FDH38_gp052 [Dinoroseobacter phage vB_DshS-R5C]|uniref:Uncharacterized protein n=1 Tax=Dinoroseobacter phage vB_DshS-R5C TaxID=1965368 RepID=A0A1V0DY67_9CAUD|nr:hypothetical protein FDH38_gp052 [Dinoroseobacter phage vB_DshS-R5C]ARB06106.1 hypothetical protein vBDshSR5C_52 [Dinoroseobacter phage vB_DshS-R5C]
MKNLQTYPVAKNGKFFGYADADQIAAAGGKLELFDENKAAKISTEAKIAESKAKQAAKSNEVKDAEAAGGADNGTPPKKGPAK